MEAGWGVARSHALRGSVAPTLRVAWPEQAPRRLAGSAMSVVVFVAGTTDACAAADRSPPPQVPTDVGVPASKVVGTLVEAYPGRGRSVRRHFDASSG